MPAGLTIFRASSDSPDFQVIADPATNAVYGNGPMGPGESVTVTIEALVDAEAGTTITNQALLQFDANRDGVNDSSSLSDDPGTPGAEDGTVLVVIGFADIPTLDALGISLMALLLSVIALGRVRSAG